MTDIKSVKEVLNLDNLSIPSFQRPYKWGTKSVIELLEDIEIAIISAERNKDFKYRFGTIILYKNSNDSKKRNYWWPTTFNYIILNILLFR